MKKILALLILGLTVLSSQAQAGDLGNPAQMLKQGHSNLGLSGDYLIVQRFKDHALERRFSNDGTEFGYKSTQLKEQSTFMATATYGVRDWLNVFGRFGVVTGGKYVDHDLKTGAEWQAKFQNDFVWAAGAKARVWEMAGGPGLLLTAQYLRYDDRKVKEWKNTSDGSGYNAQTFYEIEDKINYYWQTDLVATAYWTCGKFTPYVGGGISYNEGKYTGQWITNGPNPSRIDYEASLRSNDIVTALLGCDLNLGHNFLLNLQADFMARNEVSMGLSYNF
jgi:opacity protein-like surface antigen